MLEKTQSNPSEFWIKNIKLEGDLILSPMDGVTDQPFRSMVRRLGSAMCVTEFINALDVINRRPGLSKKLAFLESDRPVFIQLFDDDPDRLVDAAVRILDQVNPDGFDINMGCPSKSVSSRGAGAALLKSPLVIAQIFDKMTRTLQVPVSGKIRLGWDTDSLNYLEVSHIIEDNGGAMIAVHGRTKEQGYEGDADWDAIAQVKHAVKIPVIGNGDVNTVSDIQKIKQLTNCDAVMIGRAALANPWIFSRKDRAEIDTPQVYSWIMDHLSSMIAFYGERGVTLFRKFIKTYLRLYTIPRSRISKLLVINSSGDLITGLHDLFNDFPNPGIVKLRS